jgi:hypothetical protein
MYISPLLIGNGDLGYQVYRPPDATIEHVLVQCFAKQPCLLLENSSSSPCDVRIVKDHFNACIQSDFSYRQSKP